MPLVQTDPSRFASNSASATAREIWSDSGTLVNAPSAGDDVLAYEEFIFKLLTSTALAAAGSMAKTVKRYRTLKYVTEYESVRMVPIRTIIYCASSKTKRFSITRRAQERSDRHYNSRVRMWSYGAGFDWHATDVFDAAQLCTTWFRNAACRQRFHYCPNIMTRPVRGIAPERCPCENIVESPEVRQSTISEVAKERVILVGLQNALHVSRLACP